MTEKISAEMFLVIKVPKGWNFKERKWHNQVTTKNIKTKSDSKAESVGRMVDKVIVSNF